MHHLAGRKRVHDNETFSEMLDLGGLARYLRWLIWVVVLTTASIDACVALDWPNISGQRDMIIIEKGLE